MVTDKYGREVKPGDTVLYCGCTGLTLAQILSTKEEYKFRRGEVHRWQSVRAKNIESEVFNSTFNLYYFVKVDNIALPASVQEGP